jgi:hypothetical protein
VRIAVLLWQSAGMSSAAEDRDEYRDLNARYCLHVDTGPAESWAALFTEDGCFGGAGRDDVVGTEALQQFAAGLLSRPNRIHHMITNEVLDVDGDTATGSASLVIVAGGALRTSGRYADTLRRVDGHWRFATRTFTPDPQPTA